MAHAYGKVIRRTWDGRDFRGLGDAQKLLLLYIWTGPDGAGFGPLYVLTVGKICDDLGWDTARARKTITSLVAAGWIGYDWTARVVWLPRQIDEVENLSNNRNAVIGLCSKVSEVPQTQLKQLFWEKIKPYLVAHNLTHLRGGATLPPSEGLPHPLRTPESESESEPESEPKKEKNPPTPLAGGERAERTESEAIPFQEIVDDLNDVTGKRKGQGFTATTKLYRQKIKSRWNEGRRLDDFRLVHRCKWAEWHTDEKMRRHLNPLTLYGTKFSLYLDQAKDRGIRPDVMPVARTGVDVSREIRKRTGDYTGATERFLRGEGVSFVRDHESAPASDSRSSSSAVEQLQPPE